ncbi:MAG: hypothetical protein AVDCRST_MAG23-2266, partial [uncultured Sphingosinicella sp.]
AACTHRFDGIGFRVRAGPARGGLHQPERRGAHHCQQHRPADPGRQTRRGRRCSGRAQGTARRARRSAGQCRFEQQQGRRGRSRQV